LNGLARNSSRIFGDTLPRSTRKTTST
jgi:hypothetical protein